VIPMAVSFAGQLLTSVEVGGVERVQYWYERGQNNFHELGLYIMRFLLLLRE